MKILVLDIGGTNIKVYGTGHLKPVKIPSGTRMTPKRMVRKVKEATVDWDYSGVSIGYPGPVVHGKLVDEPANLGSGWVGFDFKRAFGCPVKIVNDAAMQALGSYRRGRMLFLGLGTGLGSALIMDGVLGGMELAHLPYKHGKTFEDHVGDAALKRKGEKKWKKSVLEVVARLKIALQADHVVLGGGNSRRLTAVPRGVYLGDNFNARKGGFRLWQSEPMRRALAAGGN